MNERLKFKEKIGYSFTSFGNGCWSSYINTFLLYFYTNVAGLSPAVAGTIISLTVIWDAINDPLFASMADNHTYKNGERMRPLLLWSSFPLAVCLVLLFIVYGSGGTGTAVMAFVTYFVFRIPSTLYNVPMATLRQLASPNDQDRVALGAYSTGGGSFGMAIASVAMWPLVRAIAGLDADRNMINPRLGFAVGAGIVGVIIILSTVYNYLTTKERVKPVNKEKTPFLTACRIILKNKNFRISLYMNFFYGTLSMLVSSYAVYYCQYVLCNSDLVTPVSAMYIVGVIVALPFVSRLYAKLGRNRHFALSTGILLIGSIVFMLFPKKIFAPFVFCFCIGLGTEFASVLLAVTKADITDIIEVKDGSRLDGMVGNVSNFIQKCATALLTFILGLVLEYSQYNADLATQPESAVTAIVLIMALGGLLSSIGMYISARGLRVDEEMAECGISNN